MSPIFDVILSSTGIVEDPLNHDDVSDIKLSYSCQGCFFTVLISKGVPLACQQKLDINYGDSVVAGLVARFNEACSQTTTGETIDDIDKRFDALWQEAEDLVRKVAFEPILALTKEHGLQTVVAECHSRSKETLLEYLFPISFNLQILATKDKVEVVQRPDLPVSLRFVVEPRILVCAGLMSVHPNDIRIVHAYRAHVLQVYTKGRVFCCKLNNAESQNSFLREYETLRRIYNSPLSETIRIPKLRGLVELDSGGVVGLLMELIETDHADLTALLQQNCNTSKLVKTRWKDQITETVEQLHTLGLIWGDAKAANVLIDIHKNAWLTDFGGGFTRGYLDEALYDTKEGDLQGVKNVAIDLFREQCGPHTRSSSSKRVNI